MEVLRGIYVFLLLTNIVGFYSTNGEKIHNEDDDNNNRDDNKRENIDTPRVRIKVFRGPDKEDPMGQKYAVWGFWFKQPSNG